MKTKILILSFVILMSYSNATPFSGFLALSQRLSTQMVHNIELVSEKSLVIGLSNKYKTRTKVTMRIMDHHIEVLISNFDINLFYFKDLFLDLDGKITFHQSNSSLKFISSPQEDEDDLINIINTINSRLDQLYTTGISLSALSSYLQNIQDKFLNSLASDKIIFNSKKRQITILNPNNTEAPLSAILRTQLSFNQKPRIYVNITLTPYKKTIIDLSQLIPEELKKLGIENDVDFKMFKTHFYLELKNNLDLNHGIENIELLKTALTAIVLETASRLF